jgi:hypothetical protein
MSPVRTCLLSFALCVPTAIILTLLGAPSWSVFVAAVVIGFEVAAVTS